MEETVKEKRVCYREDVYSQIRNKPQKKLMKLWELKVSGTGIRLVASGDTCILE